MNHRIIYLAAPFCSHQTCGHIRTGQRGGEGQLLFQCRTHLLVRPQAPPLPNRTAPMLILRILALPHPEFYAPDDGSQSHRLSSPVVSLSGAEGEKPRLGGRLLLAVSAPSVGVSIRVLLPALPSQSPAVSGLYC